MDSLKEIREMLEYAYDGANAMDDAESALRISRALAALNAPTDINIFTKKFDKIYIEQACSIQ